MAIAVGVKAKGRTGSGTNAISASVTTQATGSAFVCICYWGGGQTFVSLADSKGNTYTQAGGLELTSGGDKSRFYYVENGTGGASHTATLTVSGSTGVTIFFAEITGGALSGILDQIGGRLDSASPYTLASGLTTTQAAELALTALLGDSGSNPCTHAETGVGSSTIQVEETDGSSFWTGAVATSIKSSTGTFNPSWTESGSSAGMVWLATFKEAAAGGGAITGTGSAAFGGAGTLTGTGALVGAGALAFAPVASLEGTGQLIGAAAFTFTPSASLLGAGALAGVSALKFAPAAALTGAGRLIGVAGWTFTPAGVMTGAGALAGLSALAFSATGSLSSGAFAGSALMSFAPSGVLTGSGKLLGAATLSFAASAVTTALVHGIAVLSFTPAGTLTAADPFTGTASLTLTLNGSLVNIGVATGLPLEFGARIDQSRFDARLDTHDFSATVERSRFDALH